MGGTSAAGAAGTGDSCSPNPCLNSGMCFTLISCPESGCLSRPDCTCSPGFTGEHCETVGSRPACGGSGDGADCASLQALEFSNPRFAARDGGSAAIAAGDTLDVIVTITNAGSGIVPYPCVGLTSDQAIAASASLEPDVFVWSAGQTVDESVPVQFSDAIPPGTLVHFTLWVDVLNAGCLQGGYFTFGLVAP